MALVGVPVEGVWCCKRGEVGGDVLAGDDLLLCACVGGTW